MAHRFIRVCLVGSAILGSACSARFVDHRSAESRADAGPTDVGIGGRTDGGAAIDGAALSGVAGHFGRGTASIVAVGPGFELEFADDFDTTPVPSPVVVLSPRADLAQAIESALGDVRVGRLLSASGAQHYPIPTGAETLRYVHVYCDAFGVGVAVGDFEAAP